MKHTILFSNPSVRIITVAAVALFAAATSRARLAIPYTPDANTLHLWHLDDPDGLTATDAVTADGITLTNIGEPTPGSPPYNNTSLGNTSFPGLGTCVSATTQQHLLFGGSFNDVSQFVNTNTGAFTFEALVKFNMDPLGTMDAEIVCGDNGLGLNNRGWQWRISNGTMQWNLLAGSGSDNFFEAPLPSSGLDAAVAGQWYHVAVTYTGDNPTNGDTPNILTFYWTLLDPNRTAADELAQFTANRPLDGSPLGPSEPSLGIGGSARNTTSNPGNNEGIIGSMDEVRISSAALSSNQMAFAAGGGANPPSFIQEPPTNVLVGYGQTLAVDVLASGSPTLHYQWQQDGTNVPGQTASTLMIPGVTFANGGDYQLIVTNDFGRQSSSVAHVTIGAAPTGLFDTGLDTNGVLSTGDIVDPHWTLWDSADPALLGPDLQIFENNYPLEKVSSGYFSPTNGISMWIGPSGNAGGTTINSPAGQYVYRTTFLLDSADPATMVLNGTLWVNGAVSDIRLNGRSTGITLSPGGTLYARTFTITNGFVSGLNTLDFVESMGSSVPGLRVEISGIGQALAPGLPDITNQPEDQTVRDGNVYGGYPASKALFSVVATGRPPLSYQWWADGAQVPGATNRVLEFLNPIAGAQGTNFSVVVSNYSGSVTSRVAVLTIVESNQPPIAATFNLTTRQGQPVGLSLEDILHSASDPDGDPISFAFADSTGTNGYSTIAQNGVSLVYTPSAGYVGKDQFTYTLSDQIDNSVGLVNVTILPQVSMPPPVIYFNNFTGKSPISIDQTAPDAANDFAGGSSSALWNTTVSPGSSLLLLDGEVNGGGSTLLPFTPQSGYVYRMTATVSLPANSGNWVGMGFAQNNPVSAGSTSRFADASVTGYDWMIVRTTPSGNEQGFAGPLTQNSVFNSDVIPTGTASTNSLEIDLDTIGTNWTTTMFINGAKMGSYAYTSGTPSISAVGLTQNSATANWVDWELQATTNAPTPVFSGVAVAGNDVVFSGSGGAPGGGFHILSSTNVALPLADWSPAGTGSFDGQGNFSVTNAFAPGAPRNFYILQVP